MIYKFDEQIKKQIDFFYQNKNTICDFTEYDEESYINHHDDVRIFRYGHEIISHDDVKKIILDKIKKLRSNGIESYLSTSTITPSTFEFHPLVNIHVHWYDYFMRNDISWNRKNGVPFFPVEKYNHEKKLEFNKEIKSIISVRKQTHFRDYLFSKITKDTDCIFRYVNYLDNSYKDETEDDIMYANTFPTWYELSSEYDKSIFSFVCESFNGDISKNLDCQVSEKTLLAFMNGTIPIILGETNIVKLLKDMGLYVWNDEFGFGDIDASYDYSKRVDKFIKCYNNVKKLSFNESKQYWIDNQDKIQKNYDIVSNLITRNWKKELNFNLDN